MIVADSTVPIDIARGKNAIKEYIESTNNAIYAISAITVAEIAFGIYYTELKQGTKRFKEEKSKYSTVLYDFNIIPISPSILENAGRLMGTCKFNGIALHLADAIILATAEEIHAEKILTRNPEHFKNFGVTIETY